MDEEKKELENNLVREIDSIEKEQEIIDKLLELIKKEKNISDVSSVLELSEYEIIGILRDLMKKGKNIIVKQFDDGFHLLNKGDAVEEEGSTYSFETDDSNEFKFVAISDTRLGSKSQQLSILNDIYRKAQEQGIHNVILCGNISAGLKPRFNNLLQCEGTGIKQSACLKISLYLENIITAHVLATKLSA